MQERALVLLSTTDVQTMDERTAAIQSIADGEINAYVPRPARAKILGQGANVFQLDLTEETLNQFIGVALSSVITRGYWVQENNIPLCTSVGGQEGVPGENSPVPGGDCVTCPYNQWGSDEKGGRGKACKEMRRLLIASPRWAAPIMLILPPTSTKAWDMYASGLAYERQAYFAVQTSFSLNREENPDGQPYSTIALTRGPAVPLNMLSDIVDLRERYHNHMHVDVTDMEYETTQ